MPKYHISKETGRPNICRAHTKPCPLGEDAPHFETKGAARKYAEQVLAKQHSTVSSLKKEKITPDEFSVEKMKESYKNDPEGFKNWIRSEKLDDTRAKFILKHTTNPDICMSVAKSDSNVLDPSTRIDAIEKAKALQENNIGKSTDPVSFNAAKMKKSFENDPDGFIAWVRSDKLDDARANFILDNMKGYRPVYNAVLTSKSDAVTPETRQRVLDSPSHYAYLPAETFDHIGFDQNVHRMLGNMHKRHYADTMRYTKNHLAIEKGLEKFADLATSEEQKQYEAFTVGKALYRNPNVGDFERSLLIENNERLASMDRIKKTMENNSDFEKDINVRNTSNRMSNQETYQLDREKVEEYGLSENDVEIYFTELKGNFLFSGRYDSRTGVYSGYID